MKSGTMSHVKVKRLKRMLGVPLYVAVGILESMWQLCADCCDEGNIGKFSNEEIADHIEWDGDADKLILSLNSSGWLDADDEHRYMVHDWLAHCPEYLKERIRKRKAREVLSVKREGSQREIRTCDEFGRDKTGHVREVAGQNAELAGHVPSIPNPTQAGPTQPNPTQPNQETSPEIPQGDPPVDLTSPPKPPAAPLPPSLHLPGLHTLPKGFEAFWKQYPKPVSEPQSRAAYDRAVNAIVVNRSPEGWDIHKAIQWLSERTALYARLMREGNTPMTYICNSVNFLNDKRYDDDDRTWRRDDDGRSGRRKVADPTPSRGKLFDPSTEAT